MARESFFYTETNELLTLLDEAARRSAVSRGQAFEDFLHLSLCALSGGQMEEEYLRTVQKHSAGEHGKREPIKRRKDAFSREPWNSGTEVFNRTPFVDPVGLL